MKRADLQAALANANVRAFLRMLRLGEGSRDDPRIAGDEGYNKLVGGGEFTDFSHHPAVLVWLPTLKVHSTAAGAYQILRRTWDALVRQYHFPDFSPACQDEAAVALIAGRKALADVIAGRLAVAIHKCRREWASLPGAPYGQRTERYQALEAEYLKHGGTIAAP